MIERTLHFAAVPGYIFPQSKAADPLSPELKAAEVFRIESLLLPLQVGCIWRRSSAVNQLKSWQFFFIRLGE